ncbi:MAG: pyridoxal phosphate-dependent aminotransferase [Bifidobacterium sp.]|nr:pyridoxal phosphate-dependent aminotransferase [Bifidobacterium sp.]
MRFSHRVDPSNPNPIAVAQRAARAQGHSLRALNDSNPTHHGLAPDALPETYAADPRGPLASREALAAFLGDGARAGDLYLLDSTSQAYAWLMMLMCDPGDAVLAPKPGYPLIESIARLTGVDAINYQLRYDGSWTIDTAALAALLDGAEGARVRALVLINPNNPTGSYVKPDEREAIVDLCRAHGVALIADEVFFGYTLEPFDGNRRLAGEDRVLTFALDGLSKALAAPHAKVGWIRVSGPADEVAEAKARLDIIADDFLPWGAPTDRMLPGLLAEVAGRRDAVRERTRANLATLHAMLAGDGLGVTDVLRAEGGWNMLLRFPATIDENALVLDLIDHDGATGQPGYFFDMAANGYLALSLLPEPGEFAANVSLVLGAVRRALAPDMP